MGLVPVPEELCGGCDRRGGMKSDEAGAGGVPTAFSSQSWASASGARGRIARIRAARMNSPRIYQQG
jgi:hypothetical protein